MTHSLVLAMREKLRQLVPSRPLAVRAEQRQALLRYIVLFLVLPGSLTAIYHAIHWLLTHDPQSLRLLFWSLAAHPFMLLCYLLVRWDKLAIAYYVPPAFMLLAAAVSLWFYGPSVYIMLLILGTMVFSGLLLGLAQSVVIILLAIATYSGLGWWANVWLGQPVSLVNIIIQDTALTVSGVGVLMVLVVLDRRASQRLRRENLELEKQVSQQLAVLRLSEQRLRAIFDGMPVPTFAWRRIGEDFSLVDYNKAAMIQTRGGVAHYLGDRASEHYADRPDILDDMRSCYAEKSQFQRQLHYDFKRIPVSRELRATYAFVAPDTVLVHTEDITEARQTRADLLDSERRLRNLLSSIPGMSYRCLNDEHWTMTFVSEGCYDLTGYYPDEILHNHRIAFADLLAPEDLARIQASPGTPGPREDEFTVTYRIRTATGETKWVWDQGLYIKDEQGNEIALEGLILDISDRHRAEDSLRASEARNRQLVEAFADAIFVTDRDLNVISTNQAARQMLGIDHAADLEGSSFYDRLVPDDRPRARYNATHGVGTAPDQQTEYDMMRADGTIFPVETLSSLVRQFEGRGEVFIIYVRDITERRRLQEQLQTALKLEAVGRLAGGIAHDFNNLLTVINGYASFLVESHDDDDPRQGDAAEVLRAGKRAAHLTRQLLAFSRRQVMQTEIMCLNDIVQDIEPMLRPLIGERITLECALARNLPNTRVDRAQIERAITNLVTNARDAMPEGGSLRIESKTVSLADDLKAVPDDILAGNYVVLAVIDSGDGMTEEVRERALEPFYTTKEVGQGTGLGLSMVYGTVRQLGGAMRIESQSGEGTAVLLYLPECEDNVAPSTTCGPNQDALGGDETILLVEDEQIVREYVERALTQLGYTIVAARDGDHAIDLVRQGNHSFDMLLSDVVMPGINGPDLANAIDQLQPIPFKLFMSGHSHQVMRQLGSDLSQVELIRKPFSPFDLALRIRSLFGR